MLVWGSFAGHRALLRECRGFLRCEACEMYLWKRSVSTCMLVYVYMGLFSGIQGSSAGYRALLRHIRLFCGDTGLFWRDLGLFCREDARHQKCAGVHISFGRCIGLFKGFFCVYIRLFFCRDRRLFFVGEMRNIELRNIGGALLRGCRALLQKCRSLF